MDYLLPGTVIINGDKEYTVIKLLGTGASASGYLARVSYGDLEQKCILKEYYPAYLGVLRNGLALECDNTSEYESGKLLFLSSGYKQNEIRKAERLINQTPMVCDIFEANNTAYISVTCFGGQTLKELTDISLITYLKIVRTIAKTVGDYHRSNLLCLDLKPDNIFILYNDKEDIVTQLVEFIDFDSVVGMGEKNSSRLAYTKLWAAPEQKKAYGMLSISERTDIYALGELVFYYLFGRHSQDCEHRGFSNFDFEECKYKKELSRLDVRAFFTKFFRNTIRSSASNRFESTKEVVSCLDQLILEISKKDYVITNLPYVSPTFVGREAEMLAIEEKLKNNNCLFVSGIGGIGKSTIVRNYIRNNKPEYDIIIYLEYDQSIEKTFTDDMQLQISTCRRLDGENTEGYFSRKLSVLKNICFGKKTLIVVDNFSGKLSKPFGALMKTGCDVIIVSRQMPPDNSFECIWVDAINNEADLMKLIALNLKRNLSKEEQTRFSEIIRLTLGHTLVLELIARQMASGNIDIKKAVSIIKQNGFTNLSEEKVRNFKDDEESYEKLSVLVSALFDATNMPDECKTILKVLSLMDIKGMELDFLEKIVKIKDTSLIDELAFEGWLYNDDRIHVHPVIAENAYNWKWPKRVSDIQIMEYHKNLTDVYSGMSDSDRIMHIIDSAKNFLIDNDSNYVKAVFYDMVSSYYDVILGTANYPINEEEDEIFEKLLVAVQRSIDFMSNATEDGAEDRLINYYISKANILINAFPERHGEARKILKKVRDLLKDKGDKVSANRCFHLMSLARYYSVADINLEKVVKYHEKAVKAAKKCFDIDIELIDFFYIPSANNFYYQSYNDLAVEKLNEAISICDKYPGVLIYIDKKIELLRCVLDTYMASEDYDRARVILLEIDKLNDIYKDQGVYREVSGKIREILGI